MIRLYLDYSIFVDFVQKEPSSAWHSDKNSREIWNNFFSFIESGSDLTLLNVPDESNDQAYHFLTLLTQNRGNSNVSLTRNFKSPHKYRFDEDANFQSVYMLNEESEEVQRKYLRNNHIQVSFKDNYLTDFSRLIFIDKPKGRAVRKKTGDFHSWEILKDYLYKITDIVIADNYILSDRSILDANLIQMLKVIYNGRNDINLTIISYSKNPFDITDLKNDLTNKLKMHNLRDSFNLILLNSEIKEHDRGIFTNYIRIKSGDSFNYFNSKGEIITKGTELDFKNLTDPENYSLNQITLNALKEKVNKTVETRKYLKIKNRLLG
jgi:hypothetical protein